MKDWLSGDKHLNPSFDSMVKIIGVLAAGRLILTGDLL